MALNPKIEQWRGKRVWLIGASSGIGLALAEQLHTAGAEVWVSARNAAALEQFVQTYPGAHALALDATDEAALSAATRSIAAHGALDLVCYCAGHYQAMRATAIDLPDMLKHQTVNVTGALYTLNAAVPALLRQGHGHISLVSSVAGFRGLPKSLAYGPTKAALINLAETLYLDLHPHGIGVSIINPGFVQTPLTAQNDFHMPALITPQEAARHIIQGWQRGTFDIHFPKRFSRMLKLLRLLPYPLYFALVRRMTGL